MKYLVAIVILLIPGCMATQFTVPDDITPEEAVDRVWGRAIAMTYQPETGDYWKSPSETLRDNGGDCEDHAFWLWDALTRAGIECSVEFGYGDTGTPILHAWVKVSEPAVIMDSSIGLRQRYSDLPSSRYVPLYGHSYIRRKVADYTKRTKLRGFNHHYEE